jgi:mRNA-degrading endonuclease YafQ of YafQ-DinJ toxin-antitoxin module
MGVISVTGLLPFQIEISSKFQRSYKLLLKRHCKGDRQKQEMIEAIAELVNRLSSNSYLSDANPEPLPKGLAVSDDWKFYKLKFRMPNLAGASGQGRLMYLVSENQKIIKLAWIYTHAEYEKRPEDRDLKDLLRELPAR